MHIRVILNPPLTPSNTSNYHTNPCTFSPPHRQKFPLYNPHTRDHNNTQSYYNLYIITNSMLQLTSHIPTHPERILLICPVHVQLSHTYNYPLTITPPLKRILYKNPAHPCQLSLHFLHKFTQNKSLTSHSNPSHSWQYKSLITIKQYTHSSEITLSSQSYLPTLAISVDPQDSSKKHSLQKQFIALKVRLTNHRSLRYSHTIPSSSTQLNKTTHIWTHQTLSQIWSVQNSRNTHSQTLASILYTSFLSNSYPPNTPHPPKYQ